MTAIASPRGRVERVLPPFSEGALVGEVSGYTGATPYVRWGNAAVLLLVGVGFLAPLLVYAAAHIDLLSGWPENSASNSGKSGG